MFGLEPFTEIDLREHDEHGYCDDFLDRFEVVGGEPVVADANGRDLEPSRFLLKGGIEILRKWKG